MSPMRTWMRVLSRCSSCPRRRMSQALIGTTNSAASASRQLSTSRKPRKITSSSPSRSSVAVAPMMAPRSMFTSFTTRLISSPVFWRVIQPSGCCWRTRQRSWRRS